jgi:Flp pilus assembly protein TadG
MDLRRANRPEGSHRRGLYKDESGVVAIEFALVLPWILLVLFVIIDFGQVFNNLNDVNQIAANGARLAAVDNKPTGDSLQVYLEKQADLQQLKDNIDVCIEFPSGSSNVGDPVTVKAASTYGLLPVIRNLLPDLLSPDVAIQGEATMRIERPPTKYVADC